MCIIVGYVLGIATIVFIIERYRRKDESNRKTR